MGRRMARPLAVHLVRPAHLIHLLDEGVDGVAHVIDPNGAGSDDANDCSSPFYRDLLGSTAVLRDLLRA